MPFPAVLEAPRNSRESLPREANPLMQNVCIPLGSLYLCLDCDCAGDNSRQCPNCASKALLTLANCLNRPSSIPSIDPNSPEWEGRN